MSRASYADLIDAMCVTVPEGDVGNVSISRFTVTERGSEWTMFSGMKTGRGYCPPGEYTELRRGGVLWMSDTPDERRDHMVALRAVQALGARRVLVNGLGLGMVVAGLFVIPHVEEIDVCEIDADVIALVAPHLHELAEAADKRLRVVRGDAHNPADTWPKGTRWDYAWHDIWPNICLDNWESMKTVRRRHGRRVCAQDCWSAYELRRLLVQR